MARESRDFSLLGESVGEPMRVVQIPVLNDNYTYLIICEKTKFAAVVDSPDAPATRNQVKKSGAELRYIFNTHHHWDHTGANEDLLSKAKLEVYASEYDQERISGVTHSLKAGDEVFCGELKFKVLFIPGHTLGHIAFYGHGAVFCGDTLFSGGCGRLFEGTPKMMFDSLNQLKQLPDETLVYCMHEYTLANLEFALTVEPNNKALKEKFEKVRLARSNHESTVPSTIGEEKTYNPFLRADSPELIENLKIKKPDLSDDPVEIFAFLRKLKDEF